jgi:ribosomal protein S18 acetylase RimI-like enzyme
LTPRKLSVTNAKAPPEALQVSLRVGRPEDAARLATVFVAAWRSAYPGVVADEIIGGLDEQQTATWLRTLLSSSGSTTLVAESDDGDVLGFSRYGEDPDDAGSGHIFSLYVAPSVSRRGLGRRLLAHALDDLGRSQPGSVTLWVFEENAAARGFYSAFGFLPDGARRTEPEYGAEEIRLRRASGATL